MKEEKKILFISLLINVTVVLIKILGGTNYHSYALIACGIYTLIAFSTDLIAIIRSTIKRKRVTKRYLFGIGRYEYMIHLFLGIIIFLVGLYIIIKSFFLNYTANNSNIIWLIIICIVLKIVCTYLLKSKGNEISSKILMANAKESFLDVFLTIIVLIMTLLAKNNYTYDKMGSIIIGIAIMLYSLEIIINCYFLLYGNDKQSKKIKNEISKIVNNTKVIKYSDSFLIEKSKNIQCTIEIGIKKDLSFFKLLYLEEHISQLIKNKIKSIKFIDFEIIKN